MAAAVTRAQARERGNPKLLKMIEMTSKLAVDKEELVRLLEKDTMLQKFKEAKATETRKGYKSTGYVSEKMKCEILESRFCAQVVERKSNGGGSRFLFGVHLEMKKTEDKIQTNFFETRLHNDVTNFCRSEDICQKTVPRE